MARLLRVVLLALLAVAAIVGTGMLAPARTSRGPHVLLERVAAARLVASAAPAQHWAEAARGSVLDRDAVEADLDDDDDDDVDGERAPRHAQAMHAAPAFRLGGAAARPPRALREAQQSAVSRLAAGRGRLRGPPAA